MIYLELFYVFFKIGLFTFGGGYAMLPLIQAEVEGRGWVSGPDLVDFIAVSESTPGPFAVNISTYVGTQLGGIPGALCATLGVVLPSFIIILVIARFVARFRNSLAVTGCLNGLKPAVSGLIAASVISVGYTVFFPSGIIPAYLSHPRLCFFGYLCSVRIHGNKKTAPRHHHMHFRRFGHRGRICI